MVAESILKNEASLKSQMSKRNVMQRTFLCFGIFCVFCVASTIAQDVITLKNGMDIQALILEIGGEDVKFKKYDSTDGADYTLKKWGIATIMRTDGKKEDYSTIKHPPCPRIQMRLVANRREEAVKKALFEDFENRMNICGFAKRLIVHDFLYEFEKSYITEYHPLWTIGIWFNFPKGLMALRLDYNNYSEVIIPIEKLQSIEYVVDGVKITTPGYFVDREKTKASEATLRIVIGDINTGTKAYSLKLYDSKNSVGGTHLDTSSNLYKSIRECAKSIRDEIDFMALNSGLKKVE